MTPFETTLDIISAEINKNLNSNTKRIKVEGCNKPSNIQLVFTIFDNTNDYKMEFFTMKNFRFFKPDGDPAEEQKNIEKYIITLKPVLSEYLT